MAWIATVSINKNYLQSMQFLWFVLYFIVVVLNHLSGDWYYSEFNDVFNECTVITIPMMITYYIFKNNDLKLAKYIVYAFYAMLIFISIVSIIINNIVPGIIRYGLNESFMEANVMDSYYRLGLSNYNLPHAVPFLIPPIIMRIKKDHNARIRIFFYIILGLSCALIYIGGSTGALLVGILALLISSILSYGNIRKNIRKLVLVTSLFLPIILSNNIQLGLFNTIGNVLDEESIYKNKLLEFQSVIEGNDKVAVDLQSRRDLQNTTIQGFVESPIWGTNEKIGHHNSFLDRLATLGLMGFIPLLLLLFYHIKFVKNHISDKSLSYYFVGVIPFVLIMLTKSVSYWETWICFATILPVSIKLFEKRIN